MVALTAFERSTKKFSSGSTVTSPLTCTVTFSDVSSVRNGRP